MRSRLWDITLFVLASPMLAAVAVGKAMRRSGLARKAAATQIPCGTCGAEIVLVGFWRCRCGYTYLGHVLRVCPVCESFPRMVRCYQCGATERVS